MPVLILLAFVAVPLIEIALFIEIGGLIGLWETIAVVAITAAIGTWLLRAQGLSVLARARRSVEENRAPVREVFDGACLLFAGALLLTPGFMTDAFGFVLFFPPARAAIGHFLLGMARKRGSIRVATPNGPAASGGPGSGGHTGRPAGDGNVIDGEFEEVDPGRPPTAGSRWGRGSEGSGS